VSAGFDGVRVVTSCTGLKEARPGVPLLGRRDFEAGARTIETWHREHRGELRPAERMYRGQHHLRLMRGVDRARAAGLEVRLSIVSAGYGVIDGGVRIAPYEATFQGMAAQERREWARALDIPRALDRVLSAAGGVTLVLLGDEYLDACALTDRLVPPGCPTLIVCGPRTALKLPPLAGLHPLVVRLEDTRRFRCGLVGLKGEVGGRLLSLLADGFGVSHDQAPNELLARLVARGPVDADPSSPLATLF
jgi:hypothetical protein